MTRLSLRTRLITTAIILVALGLAAGGVAFYLAAKQVITTAVGNHLHARSLELLESGRRYQRERQLAVQTWAEAEAMQSSLDSGDPKFAEDYLRRTVQDRPGVFAFAALLDPELRVITGVQPSPPGWRRGIALEELRGQTLGSFPLDQVREAHGATVVLVGEELLRWAPEGQGTRLVIAAPVRDFSGDIVGVVAAMVARGGVERLLNEVGGDDVSPYLPMFFEEGGELAFGMAGRAVDSFVEPVLRAQAQGDGAVLELEHGMRYLAFVATRPESTFPRWSAAVLIPEDVALGPLLRLRRVVAVAFVLVLVAVGAVSVLGIQRAARPFVNLVRSMERVARGQLDIRLPTEPARDLGLLVNAFNKMVTEVGRAREELARTEGLRRELEIAHRIQSRLLPRDVKLPGFEVAALSRPASQVGGDFYDIIRVEDTFWLIIGDVSGHGLNAGLVMLMVQAAAQASVMARPHGSPRQLIADVNRVLHENVKRRMRGDDYVTLMAARHLGDGRFLAAGAHQPVLLARREQVEVLDTGGPWLGIVPEVGEQVIEMEFVLGPSDSVWLITDGILEARDREQEEFGIERLRDFVRSSMVTPPAGAVAGLFAAVEGFMAERQDDMTVMLLKRQEST